MDIKRKIKNKVLKEFGLKDDYGFDDWEREMDFAIEKTQKEILKELRNLKERMSDEENITVAQCEKILDEIIMEIEGVG